MPALVIPQILLCGLFVPRDQLPTGLDVLSDLLPLSYAVDAMSDTSEALPDLLVIAGFTLALLALGAATLRRRTA
jgi:ABC-2 type transport system permease protein